MKLVLLFLVCAYVGGEKYTLESCKCGEGYQAQADPTGEVKCAGIYLAHITPCNVPATPKCICTKEKVSAIERDQEGTWCVPTGGDSKKWPCENKEEWESYNVQLAEYEKTHKE